MTARVDCNGCPQGVNVRVENTRESDTHKKKHVSPPWRQVSGTKSGHNTQEDHKPSQGFDGRSLLSIAVRENKT